MHWMYPLAGVGLNRFTNFGENWLIILLSERYYVTFVLCRCKSVCRLSVCLTFVLPSQRLELFGNIFASLITHGLGQFVLKF